MAGNIFKNNEAIVHFSDNEQLTVFPKNSVWYKVGFDSNMVEFRSRYNNEVLFTENDITETTINEELPSNFITEFNQIAYASTPSKPVITDYDLLAVYNVTSTTEATKLIYETSNIDKMYIDDEEVPVGTSCLFEKAGEHTVKYKLIDNTTIGRYAFYGCGGLTEINIPNSVTSIGYQAFRDCTSLTSIEIPDSVTSIGYNSFQDCSSLTSINIPDGVTSIGENVFYGCKSLTEIEIPDSVTSIGFYAFRDCTSLTSVTIGSGVTSIGNAAFSNCTSLTSIEIPDSVTSIGTYTFYNCSSLSSVTIGSGVTSIGATVFYYCSSLTSINIPDGVTSIGNAAFSNCTSLTSIEIPDSVTSIDTYAFSNCGNLTSVTIGSGVTSIGDSAFYYCTSLTSVTCNATTAPAIANNTFISVASNGTLSFPCGSDYSTWLSTENYYLGNYNWSSECFGEELEVIADITTIIASNVDNYNAKLFNSQATVFNNHIEKMYIDGEEITPTATYTLDAGEHTVIYTIKEEPASDYKYSIYTGAFSGCTNITSAIIGERIEMIDNNAFNGCTSLESIMIPESVRYIGGAAFERTGLKEFTFKPDTIYGSALLQYSKVEKVTYLNNGTGANDCRGCKELTSVIFGDNVTSIGNYAFQDCAALTTITFNGMSCPAIGVNAFDGICVDGVFHYDCNGDFFNIKLLPEFASWQDDCTINNADITTVIYVDDASSPTQLNAESITTEWFTSTPFVEYIDKMYINGEEVTPTAYHQFDTTGYNTISYTLINNNEVPLAAFSGITSIVAVDFSDTIHFINPNAFELCINLRSLTIPDGVLQVSNGAFYSCTSLSTVVFGENVKYITWNAFENCALLNKLTFKGETAPEITSNSFAGIAEYGTIVHNCDANYNAIREYLRNWYCECPMFEVTDYEIIALFESDGTETPICIDTSNVAAIYVDDAQIALESASAYTFASAGEHTVKYKLINPMLLTYTSNGSGMNAEKKSMFYYEYGFLTNKTTKACTQMVAVGITEGVQTIGDYTFAGAKKLEQVQLPESIKAIKTGAFSGCTSLEYVNITSLESWCNISFGSSFANPLYYAQNLYVNDELVTDLVIPENITSIRQYAFYKCNGLSSVTLHNNVTSIGNYAFQYCNNLTSITIPDSVTSIGTSAFSNCGNLTSVTIGSGVTSIGGNAFYSCKKLKELVSYPTTAPTVATTTFQSIATGGTLKYYCDSSGYDAWLSTENYYLGLYEWNTQCL